MKGVILASFLLIFFIQSGMGDDYLDNCSNKLIEQIQKYNPSSIPSCVDDEKLQELRQYVNALSLVSNKIPDDCKTISSDNLKECFGTVRNIIDDQSNNVRQIILQGIQTSSRTIGQCIKQFTEKLSNLDQYILNGCK